MKIYSFPKEYEKKSTDFIVTSEGINIDVYSCDVSAYPLNRVWPGKQRDFYQTEKSSFVMLGSDGEVTLSIKPSLEFSKVQVRPLSKEIVPKIADGAVEITFPGIGQYSVEFDDKHNTITVFINPEKDFGVDKNDNRVLYFGAGVHIIDRRIELEDNQTVFIDEGAVLYGSINATDKKNIRVIGYGILDNSRMLRANEINGCAVLDPDAGEITGNPIFFNRCENVVVDGITIVNSSGWNIYLDGCINTMVNNIKIIGQWRYNADGCDFCNCTKGVLQNSYLRTFDDCVTVKGFKLNKPLPVQDISVKNCVLWCDWGRTLEIGAETCAPYIRDIIFEDCDIIHGSAVMLDIQHGDRAELSNVLFENIRVEYSGDEQALLMQTKEDEKYPSEGMESIPVLFELIAGCTMWSIDNYSGSMRDIHIKNIKVLTHNSIIPQGAKIMSKDGTDRIRDVYFENITVNENMCDWDSLGVEVDDGINGIYYNKCMVK